METSIGCQLLYNNAIEFIGSIIKYTNNTSQQIYWNTPDLKKDVAKEIINFTPNEKVKEWLKYVDKNISPFLRNDLIFVTNETYRLFDICYNLVMMQNINDPLEMIEALKLLDSSNMIEIAYKYLDVEAPLDDDMKLRAALAETYSEELASTFMQMKTHPNEYKNRAAEVLKAFYTEFYEPFEENVYNYMKERQDYHFRLFEEDPIYFINTIGLGDYSKAIEIHNNVVIYMSFHLDVRIIYFTYEDTLVMIYGQNIEHRFDSRRKQDTYKALFKALSDEKRIEILQLTSKRPWYNKELAEYFNLTTATLSYHLNLLLDLELLSFEPSIVNNRYYYTTNKENLKKLFNIALDGLLD